MTTRLSGTGIWSSTFRYGDVVAAAEQATELEGLGYTALWIPDVGGDLFGPLANLLGATSTATVATGILNVWMHTPEETAAQHAALTAEHGPRFLCGIGISHRPLIDHFNPPGTYQKPIETMTDYLDGLDAAEVPLAKADRGAGGARAEDARARPYSYGRYASVPRDARVDGEGPGRHRARRLGRQRAGRRPGDRSRPRPGNGAPAPEDYLGLPNYSNNWKRQGSPTMTLPTAAAIASSMPWSCGVTRKRSQPVCKRTATQVPTTSASKY